MRFPPLCVCSVLRPFSQRVWRFLSLSVICLTLIIYPAVAQQPIGNPIDGHPVMLDGKVLFRVRQGIPGVVSAAERAEVIQSRLLQVVADETIAPEALRVEEQEDASIVIAGDTVLFTVRDSDREGDQSRQELAAKSIQVMQTAIAQYRQDRSIGQVTRGIVFVILSTIALIGFLILLQRSVSQLLIRLRAARQADALDLRIQNVQLLGSDATSYLLSGLVKLLRLALILGGFYLYIPFVLSQFPATRKIGQSILSDISARVSQLLTTFAQSLPNLVIIAIIATVTYYVIQFAKLVIIELGRDDAYPWFYPEWVQPTDRLVTILLVIIGSIVAAPYVPGFNSPAFQGIYLLLGALFTLGSSSAVANAIAGIILIYTRAFRMGDIIQIGETRGQVVEKSLFVTRLLTFKQEVITIPNASVLNSNVVNFNAASREAESYLVIYTTVTLGYDVPWRTVHEVLIQAALATPGILPEPHPFVLQTALNDFNVSYELNAHTDCPQQMPQVYSVLHQNIQDYCNQAGIEILSPTYSAVRDGNHSTIPANYLPKDYKTPGFQIYTQNHRS
ncbi:MAG: mechanosensitive ion channel family protein [Synechococcales cyanobacterium M58_A2018_015]|nr:mechanosensitive ion channel family protein [Synechococcales cyanobacterium M58_A2018_015]